MQDDTAMTTLHSTPPSGGVSPVSARLDFESLNVVRRTSFNLTKDLFLILPLHIVPLSCHSSLISQLSARPAFFQSAIYTLSVVLLFEIWLFFFSPFRFPVKVLRRVTVTPLQ